MEKLCSFNVDKDTFCVCCGSDILLTGHESTLKVWTPEGHPLQSVLTPVCGDITSIRFSPRHSCQVAYSVDRSVVVCDTRNWSKVLHHFSFNKEEINEIDFHQNGNFVSACDDAGEIKIIDLASNHVFKTLEGHDNICSSAKFHPRKLWQVISGGLDCKVVRWNFNNGQPLCSLNSQEFEGTATVQLVNPPLVHSLDIEKEMLFVGCGLENGYISVVDVSKKKTKVVLCGKVHAAGVSQVCFSNGGKAKSLLFSGGNDKKIAMSKVCVEERSQLKTCFEFDHGSKINWLSIYNDKVYVADQTTFVSVYCVL